MAGTLIAVVVSSNTLTIQPRNGDPQVTLTANTDTDLRLNGRRVGLTRLATALSSATAASREVRGSAQYVARGGVNLAIRVRANVPGRKLH